MTSHLKWKTLKEKNADYVELLMCILMKFMIKKQGKYIINVLTQVIVIKEEEGINYARKTSFKNNKLKKKIWRWL